MPHDNTWFAVDHLSGLISNALTAANSPTNQNLQPTHNTVDRQSESQFGLPITLVGFSKGVVVLSALLKETYREAFWSQVNSVHVIDAGLNDPGGILPATTSEMELLKNNTKQDFCIYVHGTPRQLEDTSRRFVREELESFIHKASRCDVKTYAWKYFHAANPHGMEGLLQHFNILRAFWTAPPATSAPHPPHSSPFVAVQATNI
eukprot:Platyproteum_vivax@DN13173_c0_g1_i1.p1